MTTPADELAVASRQTDGGTARVATPAPGRFVPSEFVRAFAPQRLGAFGPTCRVNYLRPPLELDDEAAEICRGTD